MAQFLVFSLKNASVFAEKYGKCSVFYCFLCADFNFSVNTKKYNGTFAESLTGMVRQTKCATLI